MSCIELKHSQIDKYAKLKYKKRIIVRNVEKYMLFPFVIPA